MICTSLPSNSNATDRVPGPIPRPGGAPLAAAGLFVVLAAFLGSTAGCSSSPMVDLAPQPVPPEKTVVTVNGEPLSLDEFDNEFRLMAIHYGAVSEGDMRSIKRRLFEQVINRRLLVQKARRLGLKLSQAEVDDTFREALKDAPEDYPALLKAKGVTEGAWKRKLLQEKLAGKLVDREVNSRVRIGPDEVADYYWSHLQDYWKPESVRVLHLVVRTPEELRTVQGSLAQGEGFGKTASAFSVGPDKLKGGDWGFMEREDLPPAYWKALAGLKPGEISKPVKDGFGYHLFQLVERKPRRMAPLAEARDGIHDALMKDEENMRFDQWMADLKSKAAIKVNKEMAPVIGVTLEGLREN